jgi:phage terminase Nu1 subunit (DNA packaging protein)
VPGLTKAAIAKALNISAPAFDRYLKKGCPHDSVESARAWQAANIDLQRSALQHVVQKANVAVLDRGPDFSDDAPAARLIREKARREAAEADLAEIELMEKRSEIIPIGEHRRVLFSVGRTVRDGLRQIPSRISAQMAAESDQHACQSIIEAEIRNVLCQLAKWGQDVDARAD